MEMCCSLSILESMMQRSIVLLDCCLRIYEIHSVTFLLSLYLII